MLRIRPHAFLALLFVFAPSSATVAQNCSGSPTEGFTCSRIPSGTSAAIGTVFSASEAGGRRNVSLTMIEELVEEEATAPSGGGGGGDPATGFEIFAGGGGGWQRYDTKQALGSKGHTIFGIVGATYRGEGFLVGIAGDVNDTNTDLGENGGSRDANEYGAQIFGTVFPIDNFFFSGGARIATQDIDTKRNVESASNVARGSTDSRKYSLSAGAGYNLPIGEATVVGLSGWLAWERTETNGYSERGAVPTPTSTSPTSPNLTYDDDNYNTLDGILRVEVAHGFPVGSALVVPSVRFDYIHEFDSDTRTIEAQLPAADGDAASPLFYRTNEADEDYFRLGGSLSVAFDEGTSITAEYTGDFGHSWREEHLFTIGLSHRF